MKEQKYNAFPIQSCDSFTESEDSKLDSSINLAKEDGPKMFNLLHMRDIGVTKMNFCVMLFLEYVGIL